MKKIFLSLALVLALTKINVFAQTDSDRVNQLMEQMTIDEKLGQMTQICLSTITLDGNKTLDLNVDLFRDAILKYHVGSFLSGSDKAERWVDFVGGIQQVALDESRLGIPLILGIDHVHGANYVNEGTIFPHNLALASSFNTELAKQGAIVTREETAALGLSWNFAPVLDLGKNSRWPRLYETFGEDPVVCSKMGVATIEGLEEKREGMSLAACAKHFVGYSDPYNGWDRTPAEIPMQTLWEQYLPSFKAGFDAGVKTVMLNSGELNGMAVHASKEIVTDLLRDQMGFEGVVVTDIVDIEKLIKMHHAADNLKDAVLLSLNAGIDMYMACSDFEFIDVTKELLAEGKITEDRINVSVRRILNLKEDLGLFEHALPNKKEINTIGTADNKAVAIAAAEETVVLLKNKENVLPLKQSIKNILVTGFAANSKHQLTGAWTMEWLGQPDESMHPSEMNTLFTALKKDFPKANIILVDEQDTKALNKAAKKADAIIVTAGEQPYSEFKGNTMTLAMDKKQQRLIEDLSAFNKPTVLVMLESRPQIITDVEPLADAIMFVCSPGYGGGDALSGVISGRVNPSGKLPFSYPKYDGTVMPYYYKHSTQAAIDRLGESPFLYPFGHGLSYSDFQYSDLKISGEQMTLGQEITASVTVSNPSERDGKEAVLWFLTDEIGVNPRPVKQLFDFEKKTIKANGSQTFSIKIKANDLNYPDANGKPVYESGYYTLKIGDQSVRFYLSVDQNTL
ncbi:beta-glucosidase family protein [Persicobacter psychrovividus]|uniref:beta-glucosidase n=1 Tax=Persicobacter psychrovividus TaxID=387638 RepID=A0ABN6LC92_9BACT|nr:glycosyl hydrolase [Persicobacter psychrovividus]